MGRDRSITDIQHLVRTAFDIIDRDGHEDFSARKLAESLGISHMTVYNYLSRETILNEVIVMGFSILTERLKPYIEEGGAEEKRPCRIYAHIAEILFDFAQEHPNVYRFMFQNTSGLKEDVSAVKRLYMSGLDMVRESMAPERFAEIQKDAYLFLVLVNGLILGNLSQRHSSTPQSYGDNVARAFELILGRYCRGDD